MWIDGDAYRLMEAKLAVSPLYLASIVLPSLSSSITLSVFCMMRTIRGFPTHHSCIYLLFSALEAVLLMQYDALDPDLQPKRLGSSIPKHTDSLALSLYGKYKVNTRIFMCKIPYFGYS